MSRSARAVAGGLAVLVALAAVTTTPSQADGVAVPDAAPPTPSTHRVTLLTGDVVTLTETAGGPPTAAVEQAAGNAGGVQIQQVGDDLHVVPDVALPYLAAGRLDPELFNVTSLVDQGYDDASVKSIPLIVQYRPGLRAAAVTPQHADRGATLESIGGLGLSAHKAEASQFWSGITASTARSAVPSLSSNTGQFGAGIQKVFLDGKVEASLAESVAQVGAPDAWAQGLDGTGTTVAVLDTGIDQTHPDVAGQIAETKSFVPGETTEDVNGHGTHVASTVAGTGAASNGVEKGVAPAAQLAIGKVLNDSGSGAESWIIEGMEWAAHRAKVVSMSLGSTEASDGTDPMALAVDELSAETGALFVIAAGNYGRVSGIGSPGAAASALTVGAVDKDDARAYFQDMGPRLGDATVKPEIVAPGVDVLAARAAKSSGTGSYKSLSGTSMATPHVAGAAALLVQKHPDWTGEQVKAALVSTAKPLAGETAYQVGGGRLDVPAAAFGKINATATRDFGLHTWPHGDDSPVEQTITYTNLGDAPATLDLSTDVTSDGTTPAPAGLFTLGSAQVTVPANGTASVTVSATPNLATPGLTYSGTVIAEQDGKQIAQTAVGLVMEGERYDLNVHATGRDGKPAGGFLTLYKYGDQFVSTLEIDPATGTVSTQRLEPGVYAAYSWLPVDGQDGVALVGNPHLVIGKNTDLTLDAQKANPITLSTPLPGEDVYRRSGWYHDSGIGGDYATFLSQYVPTPVVTKVYAAPTGAVAGGVYDFSSRWRRTSPLVSMSVDFKQLHPLLQRGSKRWDGKATLTAAYVGAGAAADYVGKDVRGKAVFVTASDVVTPSARATAARDAGARLLVVVNNGAGKYYDLAGGTDLPVYSLTAAEGGPLVARIGAGGNVRLRVMGTEAPPYLYDLVKAYTGALPADLRYAPRSGELATVVNRFVGPTGELAFESRADCRIGFWPPCLQVTEPIHLGTQRIDYVSTQAGTDWYEQTNHPRGWEQRGDRHTYKPRSLQTNSWFAPAARPRVGSGYWNPRRSGDFFAVNVPTTSSGDQGVTGAMDDESTVETRLFQNGTLVRKSSFQAVQTGVPATTGWADYRFEMDTARPEVWSLGTKTTSAWDFRAQTTESSDWVYLPLIQLDYHLATDLNGAFAGGSWQRVGLSAFHLAGVEGAGKVNGATLEVSYDDGANWQAAPLSRTGADWSANVRLPKGASYISLRATATDDAGNKVSQEVIRAAAIR
ncbi:S8 family serine peptidase [Kribbella soli]|uniref:Peptidase n=1 Tax=Kribbella soli TaxID=1124743 RepID=A0A4R0HPX0_9ACTN|nr:S8 family serine peptidase [Kribbella soli]TCC11362.1 peptidase [Kribbella soli]